MDFSTKYLENTISNKNIFYGCDISKVAIKKAIKKYSNIKFLITILKIHLK